MKETKLVNLLIEKNYKIASAESCTGGMFASTIVNVPNASKVLDASIVTYANEAKEKYCGVKSKTLEKYGAVSEETAGEMAIGIAKECNCQVGISFSGIAGPSGGTADKPVGMVCFGFCINGKLETYTKHFKGNRTKVRKQSVKFGVNKLIELLSK